MCHLIFLVPLAGIPLFWMLPPGYALSINILLWIIFGFLGYKIIKALNMPRKDGFQSLIGSKVEVISKSNLGNHSEYLVRAESELWTARSPEALLPGEKVSVAALDGIKLIVKR